jgi:mutual gliding-motility protein MglA
MPVTFQGSLNFKLVYFGPGLAGKTTSMQWTYDHARPKSRGKLISLATETDRTLFFDLSPHGTPALDGLPLRLHLYTVPGPVFYDRSRQLILKGADGVIFLADSQLARMEANVASFEELEGNLLLQGHDPDTFPMVMQYNKRDLPTAVPVAELQSLLNPDGRPHVESVAYKGVRVAETIEAVWALMLDRHADADLDPTILPPR